MFWDGSQDNIASLYRSPFALMHSGPFEKVIDPFLLSILKSTILDKTIFWFKQPLVAGLVVSRILPFE